MKVECELRTERKKGEYGCEIKCKEAKDDLTYGAKHTFLVFGKLLNAEIYARI